ncbi:putative coatomer protein complex, subunit alpha, partial [Cardiosporidium cionae]
MLVKCETKSSRVKGISFHPKLSWILASLHNGQIQLWDYRIGSLIDKFEDHKGPVRSVCFHSSQPLFVSGGDDSCVKVWNYRQRRCIFSLLGHLDYIRTVQFHPEYPWILSASDDQTVRIWNWQSRNCIAVLTGHNHYVMCAQFHPKQDLVVSASLDQSVRIWNVSGLREKTVSMASDGSGNQYPHHVDMFGTSDVVCKVVLEGHDRGVNFACFHATLPIIASGADDRYIKLWRYNDLSAWEMDTLKGHFNNVSCVAFHPQLELLLSNSEDRTIRVWDVAQRTCVHTYRRENDRFWTLNTHLNSNLLAVGHDSGMVVFKMDCERPAFSCHHSMLFHIKENNFQMYNFEEDHSVSITTCRKPSNAMSSGPKHLLINIQNSTEINALFLYPEGDAYSYDLIICDNLDSKKNITQQSPVQTRSGNGVSLAFASHNRFALLDGNNSLGIYNLNNELTKRIKLNITVDKIFSAGHNRLLLKHDETVSLYDLTTRKIVASIACNGEFRRIVCVAKSRMWYLDRAGTIRSRPLQCEEFLFKLALHKQKFNEVSSFIKSGRLIGNCVIGYLRKKGYPQIALFFVKDLSTRFHLALEYGDIGEAFTNAVQINEKNIWNRLATEALRRGNHHIVELAYQKMKNFDQLSFLYFITGNSVKLGKMLLISEKREDVMGRYQNALLLGDVKERVRVLAEVGQLPLAALIAKVHHLSDLFVELQDYVKDVNLDEIIPKNPRLLIPPSPVF